MGGGTCCVTFRWNGLLTPCLALFCLGLDALWVAPLLLPAVVYCIDVHPHSKQSRYWTAEEHERFLKAVEIFGPKNYVKIASVVATRNAKQVRTHHQKYEKKLEREAAKQRRDGPSTPNAAAFEAVSAAAAAATAGTPMMPVGTPDPAAASAAAAAAAVRHHHYHLGVLGGRPSTSMAMTAVGGADHAPAADAAAAAAAAVAASGMGAASGLPPVPPLVGGSADGAPSGFEGQPLLDVKGVGSGGSTSSLGPFNAYTVESFGEQLFASISADGSTSSSDSSSGEDELLVAEGTLPHQPPPHPTVYGVLGWRGHPGVVGVGNGRPGGDETSQTDAAVAAAAAAATAAESATLTAAVFSHGEPRGDGEGMGGGASGTTDSTLSGAEEGPPAAPAKAVVAPVGAANGGHLGPAAAAAAPTVSRAAATSPVTPSVLLTHGRATAGEAAPEVAASVAGAPAPAIASSPARGPVDATEPGVAVAGPAVKVEAARLALSANEDLSTPVASTAPPAASGGTAALEASVALKVETLPVAIATAPPPVEPAVESARALAADEARRQAPKASKV